MMKSYIGTLEEIRVQLKKNRKQEHILFFAERYLKNFELALLSFKDALRASLSRKLCVLV